MTPGPTDKTLLFFSVCSGVLILLALAVWDAPTTSPLASVVRQIGIAGVVVGAILGFLCLSAVRRALPLWVGKVYPLRIALIAAAIPSLLGIVGFGASSLVENWDLHTLGFKSRDDLFSARAVGAQGATQHAAYQRAAAASDARAVASERLEALRAKRAREQAAAMAATDENLVVGRWVMPIDLSGYILTIRHKGDGYEAFYQWEKGQTGVYALRRHTGRRERYDSQSDPVGTYFVVLSDGRLDIRNQDGDDTTLNPIRGAPGDADSVDAAIQGAFQAARALHEEDNCRQDANCWSERYRVRALELCTFGIEHSATFDLKWTDGWLDAKFLPGATWHGDAGRRLGQIDYRGDKLMLQNGFGAWQNVIYTCTYDTKKETVVDVRSRPGRLSD